MERGGGTAKRNSDDGSGAVDKAELGLAKADAEASLAVLNEYLRQDKALNDEAYKDHLISIAEFFDRKLEIELQANQQSMAAKQRELAEAEEAERKARERMAEAKTPQESNKAEADMLKAQAEEAKLLGAINVLEAQRGELIRRNGVERADAEKKLRDELTMIEAGSTKAAAESDISKEKADLEMMKQLRQVSAEDAFAAERAFEQRSYAATQAYLAVKRAALQEGDQTAIASANAASEQAERQHQARMTQIDRAANLERRKYGIEAANATQGAFANMLSSVFQGTARMSAAFKAFGMTIGKTFADLAAKKLTDSIFNATGLKKSIEQMTTLVTDFIGDTVKAWLTADAVKTSTTAAGAMARTGIEASAAATSKSITIGDAIMTIGAKAWQAAASVYASIAMIPYVGPFLAPAMAIAAGAAVIGFIGRIASSEGGEMQVGEDRLNFVHRDETILPKGFADGLRSLVGEGSRSPFATDMAAMRRDTGATVAAVSAAPRWSLPDLGPSRTSAPAASLPTSAPASARGGGGGGGRAVELHGTSAGEFFIANRKHLTQVLRGLSRDFVKP